jgi:transposase
VRNSAFQDWLISGLHDLTGIALPGWVCCRSMRPTGDEAADPSRTARSSWDSLETAHRRAQGDVTPKYGNWNTIYRRFRRWSGGEVWETLAVTLAEIMADSGTKASIAPQSAPTSRQRAKEGAHRRGLGRSRVGSPDADPIRADLAEREIKAVIPGRLNRRLKIKHDRTLYKQRNRIERMFGYLKINRSIATRYDQLAETFLSMVHIAAARY